MATRAEWPRRRNAALALLLPLLLAACATPETVFDWHTGHYAQYAHVVVHRGDTVSEIAARYHVSTHDVVAMNNISHPRDIYPGQVLVVPRRGSYNAPAAYAPRGSGTTHRRVIAARNVPRPARRPSWYSGTSGPAPAADVQSAEAVSAPIHFEWPVQGSVISRFGTKANGGRNDGINIATQMDSPIHAAASGTVIYAGNALKGYGNLVLIRHSDGYITAYAHADRIAVDKGQQVGKGQVIGYAGQTGDVAAPQLHFEIRHGVHPLDPKPLLIASN